MVKPADRFECVEQQREPEPRIVLKSRSDGQSIELEAAAIAKQLAVSQSDTLIVLDNDSPYEERLHLVLLRGSRIIDYIEIGGMYVSGIFKPIDMRDRELRFRFESDTPWTLSVEAKGRRVLGGLPAGARRARGFFSKRYLFLQHGAGE